MNKKEQSDSFEIRDAKKREWKGRDVSSIHHRQKCLSTSISFSLYCQLPFHMKTSSSMLFRFDVVVGVWQLAISFFVIKKSRTLSVYMFLSCCISYCLLSLNTFSFQLFSQANFGLISVLPRIIVQYFRNFIERKKKISQIFLQISILPRQQVLYCSCSQFIIDIFVFFE